MSERRTICDVLGVDVDYLTDVVAANPSLRGVIIGYVAERKLRDLFESDDRITAVRKDDDHDRASKGDLVITYQGCDFRVEVKSLQTNSVQLYDDAANKWVRKVVKQALPGPDSARRKYQWRESPEYQDLWRRRSATARFKGSVQCDASDNREIALPGGGRVKTTNLLVNEFDILALGLFAFRECWDFGFLLNRDLPRSTSPQYPPEVQQHLLKTSIPVEWPLPANCAADPFILLDALVAERRRKKPSRGTSGKR